MTFDKPAYITGRAAEEWDRMLGYMRDNKYDQEQYQHTYASYCQAVAHIEEAVHTIELEGLTVSSKNDALVKHPAFQILKEANDRMFNAAKVFGFIPRELVGKEPDKNASNNPLERLRAERPNWDNRTASVD